MTTRAAQNCTDGKTVALAYMIALPQLATVLLWLYGMVWLFAASFWWGLAGLLFPPAPIIYGFGHLLGAW